MVIDTIYTIWLREIKRFIRAKPRIIGTITMPLLWFAIMGVGLNSSFKIADPRFTYLNFMTPGIIGMTLLFNSIFSAVSVIWEKQFGFLKEILVSPISRTSIVIGKVIGSTTIALIGAFIFLVIAAIFHGLPLSTFGFVPFVKAVIFMVLISFSFISLGLIIASKINNMEGFQVIMNLLVLPLFFLSGAFFPMQNAPSWMQVLAHGDPLMYGVDGMRNSLLGISEQSFLTDVSILLGFSFVAMSIATFVFRRIQ